MTLLTTLAGPTVLPGFLTELSAATLYKNWRAANPGEAARFDDALATGSSPPMVTAFGRALVIAANNL